MNNGNERWRSVSVSDKETERKERKKDHLIYMSDHYKPENNNSPS